MKIKCTQISDEDTGDVLQNSSWLTVGKTYHVLSVNMDHGSPVKFQVISDDGQTPVYHNANQFEVVSNKIPEGWVIDFVSKSYLRLSPKAWSKPGFWEEYFDGEPEAIDVFNAERNIIEKLD